MRSRPISAKVIMLAHALTLFSQTDDEDVLLGGFGMGEGGPLPTHVPKLREQATIVKHWYAHTPVW